MRRTHGISFGLVLLLSMTGCGQSGPTPTGAPTGSARAVGQDGWLMGDAERMLDTVADHLRGMDVAMVEIDHRYNELYWAGTDGNWEYAAYQLEKIQLSLEQALKRRPLRRQSAQAFLTDVIPRMQAAIDSRESGQFERMFNSMTTNCNACHVMEKMAFIRVAQPQERRSSVRGGG